ncbi:hypothetical protein [Paludibaculum fermentans]|uniref:hypothetical protein n=1 Tax=Paludibaculum fermentans TaxID=1473598 RepID=UPI003EBC82A3
MTDEQLDRIFASLQDANCPFEMNVVLSPLSDDDLQATYANLLVQYGQELALGALERSEWPCGNLIVNANQASICFVNTVLDAVRSEIRCRKAV